jgi:dsRNA-specific ribonuclease
MSNNNVERIINRKLNEYESPQSFNPKIIADVFESLVGAIYFDSDIEQCFKFLNKIYKPFIIYTWFYFDELKYSAINDFTHLCTFKYKTAPEFHARVHNGEHYVDIYLNNKKEFTGKGESVESAKANAAILGLKYFSNK